MQPETYARAEILDSDKANINLMAESSCPLGISELNEHFKFILTPVWGQKVNRAKVSTYSCQPSNISFTARMAS